MTLLEQLVANFAQRLNRVAANSIWTFKSQLKMYERDYVTEQNVKLCGISW